MIVKVVLSHNLVILLLFTNIVTLFAYLRIDVFHPFVCIHVVGTTAKFMVFVVVSVYHLLPAFTFLGNLGKTVLANKAGLSSDFMTV